MRHLKKLSALLLSIALLLTVPAAASAKAVVDLSQISGNELYDISVNTDSEVAFVTATLSASSRSFTHKYENDNYYSCLESDLLVHDYYSSSPYAVMRTWIYYYATEYLYPTSVTFTIQGTDYTFSAIGNKDWSTEDGKGGTKEELLIIYGDTDDHVDFIVAMIESAATYLDDDDSNDAEIPMVIHGTSDVEATLGAGPLLDLFMIANAMSDIGGKLEDSGSSCSTLSITLHQ